MMEKKKPMFTYELLEELSDGTEKYQVVRTRPVDEVKKEITRIPSLPLKINLSKEGLDMLFRDYEVIMLQYVWGSCVPKTSRILYEMVNEHLPENKTMSRASVIFAANRFVDNGIWSFDERTGKGGYRRRYYAALTEKQLWEYLRVTVIKKLVEASGDSTLFDGKWEIRGEPREI